ncbi:MAG: DoxX family protein [Maribacter sp.]|nr:DoxX family protein [Maribacter sp.]
MNNATVILLLLFLVITFVQSGLDKITDWNGNLSWLKGHFAQSPLKNIVPLLLGIILIIEMVSGLLCAIGVYQFIIGGESSLASYGAVLACIALLMLLFGQRMAKDYDGARTIAIYFIPAIFLVFLLHS